MAGKLISLEEAASMLGVSPAELSEMRQRGEINGMRDGAGWKFKQEEIERARNERGAGGSSLAFDLPLDMGSKQDVVLSDLDLLESGISKTPGKGDSPPAGGSDIELKMGSDSGLDLLSSSGIDSGLGRSPGGATPAPGSGLNLGGSGIDLLGSDVKLASGIGSGMGGSGSGVGSGLDSNVLTGSSSGGSGGDAGKTMLTAELADKPAESSIKMTMRDNESVFGEPDSDVSRHIEGSGINLLDARDSGLNLDDLQLASSISGISKKKKPGGSDLEMKGEEDFLLTPLEEQADDSTDSGSQVIALEGEFGDDATATLMAGDVPGLGSMLEAAAEGGAGPLGSAPMGMGGPVMYAPPPEPSYGIGTVAALGFSTVVMAVVGVMMYDLIRNMWSWDTPYTFNSSLMDMILGLLG
jgi:hypothetical protein